MRWTEESSIFDPITRQQVEERTEVTTKGLPAKGGEGRQLPVWYEWWKLRRKGKTILEIARGTDSEIPGSKTFDERTVRKGIEAVERMMLPVEKPSMS